MTGYGLMELHGRTSIVTLNVAGPIHPAYELIGEAYVPWRGERSAPTGDVDIHVTYDRTTLHQNETMITHLTLRSHAPSDSAMLMVDVGIPPGFEVDTDPLGAAQERGKIEKYELTPRQAILYLSSLAASGSFHLDIPMHARFPVHAVIPPSTVYQYYNPGDRSTTARTVVDVLAGVH